MNSQRDVGVLIPAAGRGERVGGEEPKQFRQIAGVPMLLRAITPFLDHPRVDSVVVALPKLFLETPPSWLDTIVGNRLLLVGGGATRAASVKAALDAVSSRCQTILVHDAARPFVSRNTIDSVIEIAGHCGAVPAVPVSDTIKRAEAATGVVIETVNRSDLWRAQTPQGCPRDMLEAAYAKTGGEEGWENTDEAALLEMAGYRVKLVPDDPGNFKVTTAADFLVAEAFAAQ